MLVLIAAVEENISWLSVSGVSYKKRSLLYARGKKSKGGLWRLCSLKVATEQLWLALRPGVPFLADRFSCDTPDS